MIPVMKKQTLLFATAILSIASLFSSCKKDEVKSYANINLIHASADAPAFNVYVNKNPFVVSTIPYGGVTGYIQKESGSQKFNLNTKDSSVYTFETTVEENKNYSLFLIDSFKRISALLVTDDLATPPNGKARLRFVQISPNAPKLDVVNKNNNDKLFSGLLFKDATGFIEVTPGVYDLDLRPADSAAQYTFYQIPNFVISNGKSYTIYTQGFFPSTYYKTLFNHSFIVNKQ